MLARIRSALAVAPAEPVEVPRDYERSPFSGTGDADRFADAVAAYSAGVHRIGEATTIPETIANLVETRERVVVPADVPKHWIAQIHPLVDARGAPLTVQQLDHAGAVVTGCALGIAATGTVVLDAGVAQGRRALSLVPDHHICVVFARQVVDTVPQAFAALNPSAALTLISGPSATSDIELNRVEGVHGPRRLDVVLVDR
ncbi:LutC/YkgG family protein [Mycolicibacterium sp. XJ879]